MQQSRVQMSINGGSEENLKVMGARALAHALGMPRGRHVGAQSRSRASETPTLELLDRILPFSSVSLICSVLIPTSTCMTRLTGS